MTLYLTMGEVVVGAATSCLVVFGIGATVGGLACVASERVGTYDASLKLSGLDNVTNTAYVIAVVSKGSEWFELAVVCCGSLSEDAVLVVSSCVCVGVGLRVFARRLCSAVWRLVVFRVSVICRVARVRSGLVILLLRRTVLRLGERLELRFIRLLLRRLIDTLSKAYYSCFVFGVKILKMCKGCGEVLKGKIVGCGMKGIKVCH